MKKNFAYFPADNSEVIPNAPNFKLTTNPQRGQDPYPHRNFESA
ncbi:12736_t:CDS:2 [Racocetra fulgida]|uniref:12736_t:CDS:1 n=1 Tax=Racocetra fulgida TaxID=60492 RepID=A0A9N9F7T8_9GLOM|nr:12736_t:CDS:2 [Racocetra fulgida]